jgi:ATP-dependent DNA helicase RecG
LGKIISNRQDLTFEQLKIYYNEQGLKLRDNFAANLELLTENGVYNYIAYLMADNNGNSIKVAKYSGTDRIDLIESNEYGYCSLIKATKRVLDKLEIENKTLTQITYKERIDNQLWDPVALREAVINAMVHNDYSNEAPPKFEIFPDRIEITSSGGLVMGLSEKEFFEGYSVPRNKEFMRIFKDLDMVEYLGSGIPRILRTYSRECFIFTDNFVRMVFPIDIKGGQEGGQISSQEGGQVFLTKRQQEIFDAIKNNPEISRKDLASMFNINESAIQKHVNKLKEFKRIERIGTTKGRWRIL